MKFILLSALPVMLFIGSVAIVYLLWAMLWMTYLLRRRNPSRSGRMLTTKYAICLHVLAGIGILCMLYGYFVEPYFLQVNHVVIETDKLQNARFRVVQISDLHCDSTMRLENKLPDAVNALQADIVVFTGDALNRASALNLFQNTLQQIEAPLGRYAVKGNWDATFWSDLDLFENTGFTEVSGCQTVQKEGEAITVSGLAYNGRPSVTWAFRPETFNLFLYHTTDLVDTLATEPVDLYLSGHTHGGQIALPFYGALITLSRHGKKFEAGFYRHGDINIYVNRGIGMEGGRSPKVRFWARPEVTVFDIVPRQANRQALKK